MKLLIKQRVFSWTDTYDVYDEEGKPVYYVKADFFTFGHQIHVFDKNSGREAGGVFQKLMTLMPVFEVKINDVYAGEIRKKFALFKPQYEIDFNGWRVEGDFFGWNYDVYSGDAVIAHITKELLAWGDTYVIDINNPQDELMGLLLVIAIDAVNCSND